MPSIPPEVLSEYLKLNIFKEYDLSPEAREEHDILADFGRKHRCPNCQVPLTIDQYETDAGLCKDCNIALMETEY